MRSFSIGKSGKPAERIHFSNFEERTIDKINKLLIDIKVPVIKTSAEEAIKIKDDYKARLNEIYGLITEGLTRAKGPERAQYLLLLGDVMMKYGRIRYEENYPSCMVMMRGSLNAQMLARVFLIP